MPKLDIDMFDESPKIGDKVKVTGKVKSINEDSGEVEVSYDDVTIVGKEHKAKKKRDYNPDYLNQTPNEVAMNEQMAPNSQSLDQALSQSFPMTQ